MSQFLCKLVTVISQQHHEYALLEMKDWHPKRRNAQNLVLLSYLFVFLCVSHLLS